MKTKMFGLVAVGVAAMIAGLAATAVAGSAAETKKFTLKVPVEISKVVEGVKVSVNCNVTAGQLTGSSAKEVPLKDGAYAGTLELSGEWQPYMSTVWPTVTDSEKDKIKATYSCELSFTKGKATYGNLASAVINDKTMGADPNAKLVAQVDGSFK